MILPSSKMAFSALVCGFSSDWSSEPIPLGLYVDFSVQSPVFLLWTSLPGTLTLQACVCLASRYWRFPQKVYAPFLTNVSPLSCMLFSTSNVLKKSPDPPLCSWLLWHHSALLRSGSQAPWVSQPSTPHILHVGLAVLLTFELVPISLSWPLRL